MSESKPTIGLCLITKEYTKELDSRLFDLSKYFDKIYVQVNGKPETKGVINTAMAKLSYFKWTNDFADARNALLTEVKTDYWMWLDTDDEILHPERIPMVVGYMAANGVDMMLAPYHYQIDKSGITTELQNRERIVRTAVDGKWYGAVHETWIPTDSVNRELTDQIQWVHRKSPEEHGDSMLRNRAILEDEYAKEPRDPRIAYYLGLNYMIDGTYDKAIEAFLELIKTGEWDEERYRAWIQIGSALHQMGKYDDALEAYGKATLELPEWPDAYYLMQQIYYDIDQHHKSIEWFNVGRTKPEPETDSARNPIINQYQPRKFAGYSYLATGEPDKAMAILLELQRVAPQYPIEPELKDAVLQAHNEAAAIKAAKLLIDYNEKYEANPLAVLNSLPPTTRAHIDLTEERRRLIPGRVWAKGTVVFWCGQSYEPWGPEVWFMDKGMGGAEEAIVYLAGQLQEDGLDVTVYNERQKPYLSEQLDEGGIQTWLPWTEINPNDEYDVFVAWRDPSQLKHIKARLKLCDLHDTMTPEYVYHNAKFVDKYLVKSQYHRSLYPDLSDDKFIIVGNGIVKEQFK